MWFFCFCPLLRHFPKSFRALFVSSFGRRCLLCAVAEYNTRLRIKAFVKLNPHYTSRLITPKRAKSGETYLHSSQLSAWQHGFEKHRSCGKLLTTQSKYDLTDAGFELLIFRTISIVLITEQIGRLYLSNVLFYAI